MEMIIGTIRNAERLGTSINGNPSYQVELTDGRSYTTADNAMLASEITKYAGHNVTLTLERNRIVSVQESIPPEAAADGHRYERGWSTMPGTTEFCPRCSEIKSAEAGSPIIAVICYEDRSA